jgi:hypothetical protein
MTRIITNAGAVGDHAHESFHRDAESAQQEDEAPPPLPTADATDIRLIIEDDKAGGGFIYTTLDRRTGAVIRQLPRDRLLELSEAPDYAAGALIKARA